ncbi:MAG: 50S ribosomal protein L3 [Planctomycetota bacterium]
MTLLLGRKRGMTQVFAADGKVTPVTVVEAGPCTVMQVRSQERDGYDAVQLGFEEIRNKLVSKPVRIAAEKAGVAPKRFLREQRLKAPATHAVGEVIKVDAFTEGQLVDVIGTIKGRGFAGTIKRHNFNRGPKSHGSMNYRQPGSIGSSAYPNRVIKGKRMSGHYGATRETVKNLEIVRVDLERNLLLIKGSVPGHNGGFVQIRVAKTGMPKAKTSKTGAPKKG